MHSLSHLRNSLLVATACGVLAACSGSGNIANNGDAGPVTVNNGGGGGGGSQRAVNLIPNGVVCPVGTIQDTVVVTVPSGDTDITACYIDAGTLTGDLEIPANTGFGLRGSVFVGDNLIQTPAGTQATLTLNAGVILFGAQGEDALFVSPGSQIFANGTQTNPVIMTSASDLADGNANDGLVDGSTTARGEWGGLVISGLAPINDCDNTTIDPVANPADCTKTGEGGSGLFGGDNPNDNSGRLNFVRVQYAGFRFNDTDELNGIAFQGVGDATFVDNIQVHNNQDDGVEFFGGTVNADHVFVSGAGDDSIDWTDGWNGDVQFALVVQDDTDGDRGIEGDNRSNDVDIMPRSMPNISNFTFFGGATGSDGVKLRAGTAGQLANGIVIGFPGDGLDHDDDSATGAAPTVDSLFVSGNGAPFDSAGGVLFNNGMNNLAAAGNTMDGVIPGAAESAVMPTDISVGNDLDFVNYIGAFDPVNESNADNWTTGWTIAGTVPGAVDAGCPMGTTDAGAPPAGFATSDIAGPETRVCDLPNVVTSDLTLTSGTNLYRLNGAVFVGTDAGPDAANPAAGSVQASLTIAPGAKIFGAAGEDALVVTRGSQIFANGTQAAPIIMTSFTDVNDTVTTSSRGDWGGLVISGQAPINDCDNTTVDPVANPELCEKTGEGGSGLFGGNDAMNSSGNLSFVQVKYAGFRFNDTDELNGIAFQGVGSGTNVDSIQVHNNQDDGVEFFGGTVNVSHIVLTGNADDSLDWTDGWVGSAQFVICAQADDDGDRCIEGDNRGNDTEIMPRSNPLIANVTFLSNGASDGIKLRAGTDGEIYNAIVVGGGENIDFDVTASGVIPSFFNSYIVDAVDPADTVDGDTGNGFAAANGNVDGDALGQDSTLTTPAGFNTPLIPGANEMAPNVSPAASLPAPLVAAPYVGAVADANDDWYVGWTFTTTGSGL